MFKLRDYGLEFLMQGVRVQGSGWGDSIGLSEAFPPHCLGGSFLLSLKIAHRAGSIVEP